MQAPEFLHTMKGPPFLGLYVLWFVAVFGTVLWLRRRNADNHFIDLAGAAVFLALGIIRIVVGTAHGMRKWEFLLLLMFFGTIVFFLRADSVGGSSSGSDGCSSGGGGCGGASCGGSGGCGGGGCGGCGGS